MQFGEYEEAWKSEHMKFLWLVPVTSQQVTLGELAIFATKIKKNHDFSQEYLPSLNLKDKTPQFVSSCKLFVRKVPATKLK